MHRRIIIGALSARQYPERRRRCRETWFNEATLHPDIETLFLIGAADEVTRPTLIDDLLLLPCANDYNSLPQRTRWFCQWAMENRSFDYLFKCDDDTFVCLDRLANYDPRGHDYIGAEWRPGAGYASGGAGYFLSRRAAEIVARHLQAGEGAEDKLVGEVLRASGIGLAIDERFTPYGNHVRRPSGENALITAHAVPGDLFRQCHRETSRRWPFRIVMPALHGEAEVAHTALRLLDRSWPARPQVDLLTQTRPAPPLPGVEVLDLARDAPWSRRLREYLERYNRDQFVLLMPPLNAIPVLCRGDVMRQACDGMCRQPEIGVVYLTWQPVEPKPRSGELFVLPRGDRLVRAQPALWRRDVLLRLLHVSGDVDMAQFERRASEWVRDYAGLDELYCQTAMPDPAGTNPPLDLVASLQPSSRRA